MDSKIISEVSDLRDLDFTRLRKSEGIGGSCLKARRDGLFYKLSRYREGEGIVGLESVYELIADRLLTILKIDHLSYTLQRALIRIGTEEYETWLCVSKDYRQEGESKCSLTDYYDLEKYPYETPLDFCIRQGWEDIAWNIFLTDYIICNRERNGSGLEVIKRKGSMDVRLAPIGDHGCSMLFQCREDRVAKKLDVLRDTTLQSFLGGRSLLENLQLVPEGRRRSLPLLQEAQKEELFAGMEDILSSVFRVKIWEMLQKRVEKAVQV